MNVDDETARLLRFVNDSIAELEDVKAYLDGVDARLNRAQLFVASAIEAVELQKEMPPEEFLKTVEAQLMSMLLDERGGGNREKIARMIGRINE